MQPIILGLMVFLVVALLGVGLFYVGTKLLYNVSTDISNASTTTTANNSPNNNSPTLPNVQPVTTTIITPISNISSTPLSFTFNNINPESTFSPVESLVYTKQLGLYDISNLKSDLQSNNKITIAFNIITIPYKQSSVLIGLYNATPGTQLRSDETPNSEFQIYFSPLAKSSGIIHSKYNNAGLELKKSFKNNTNLLAENGSYSVSIELSNFRPMSNGDLLPLDSGFTGASIGFKICDIAMYLDTINSGTKTKLFSSTTWYDSINLSNVTFYMGTWEDPNASSNKYMSIQNFQIKID
jgi:hypothetical protein